MSELLVNPKTTSRDIRNQSILGAWISRVMSATAPHQPMVHPCIIDGEHTLVHERGLGHHDPAAHRQILEFADANGFKVKEDQRADFIAGVKRVKNKRHANVVTIMALTSSLLATSFSARAAAVDPLADVNHEVTQPYSAAAMGKFANDEELMAGLIGWINEHSTFQHDIHNLPRIMKVDAGKMASVAFGGELPAAIDPEKLQIYGLYNFNEKAVYILDSLDMESEQGRGILLHELVHYLQYQYEQDENVKCKNELESLAYILEAKYLESHDHDHKINMKHINKVSQCA